MIEDKHTINVLGLCLSNYGLTIKDLFKHFSGSQDYQRPCFEVVGEVYFLYKDYTTRYFLCYIKGGRGKPYILQRWDYGNDDEIGQSDMESFCPLDEAIQNAFEYKNRTVGEKASRTFSRILRGGKNEQKED